MALIATANNRLVAGVIVAVVILAFGVFLVVSALGPRRRKSDVAPALRSGPSDEELERRVLERYLALGAVATIFMAVFLPLYWLREPTRIDIKAEKFREESVKRGKIVYEAPVPGAPHFSANCARCHGLNGEGTVQPFQETKTYAEPPLRYIVARYKAAGRNDEDIRQLIRDAIERGRPGTLMPTWGLQFGGPLNAQQVEDLISFIYSIQEAPSPVTTADGRQLFEQNCAVCHGANARGGVGPDLTVAFSRLTRDDVAATIATGRLNVNRPSMPSWAFLGKPAIQALVNFLESIQRGPGR
jgi:cbb3-type cytochrome c oxidase subunit III